MFKIQQKRNRLYLIQIQLFYSKEILYWRKKMPQKDILDYTIWIGYEHLMCRNSLSDTYLGINNKTGQDVSVNIIKRKTQNQALQSLIIEQISICQQAISDNIIKIYHIEVTKDKVYLIQQKWDEDLYHYIINQSNGKLSQNRAIQILKDICKGYYQLFRNGIVHRDLKSKNIILCNGVAKIANFDLAIKRHKNHPLSSKCGTLVYMSPQFRTGQIVTSKSDIWALGVTFYEMLHGELPWPNGIDELLSQQQLRLLSYLSPNTKRFLMKCLRIHPKDRLSWDQLFHDPIFEGYFSYKYDEDQKLQDKFRFKLKTMKQKMVKNKVSLKQFLKRFEFGNGTQIQEIQLKVLIEEREPGISIGVLKVQ